MGDAPMQIVLNSFLPAALRRYVISEPGPERAGLSGIPTLTPNVLNPVDPIPNFHQ